MCEQACNGEMGVPITFMDKRAVEQFELIGHEHDINGNGGDGVPEGAFEIVEKTNADATDIACSQTVNVEREREREREQEKDGRCTNALSFAGCRKCNGIIGVPITFLDKYCPEQFRIVGFFNNYNPETADNESGQIYGTAVPVTTTKSLFRGPAINGQAKYFRILIFKV